MLFLKIYGQDNPQVYNVHVFYNFIQGSKCVKCIRDPRPIALVVYAQYKCYSFHCFVTPNALSVKFLNIILCLSLVI